MINAGRSITPGVAFESREIAAKQSKGESPLSGEKLQQFAESSGLNASLGKLRDAALSLKGRTHIEGAVIGGLGVRYVSTLFFGPGAGLLGAAAGAAFGLVVAEVLTHNWSFGKTDTEKTVPPGSDALMNPDIKASSLLVPELQKELDRVTDSEISPGNRVTLLRNGAASFPERYRMMEGAKHSINLQTLILHSDETGWKTAELLAKKAKEGVKCRVIYDWISSADSDPKMFKVMKDAGVEVIAFNPPGDYQWHGENAQETVQELDRSFRDFVRGLSKEDLDHFPQWMQAKGREQFELWKANNRKLLDRLKAYPPGLTNPNERWHMKILTVDGKETVVGGLNIGSEYAYGGSSKRDLSHGSLSFSALHFRDTDIKAEGPVVEKINQTFAENWKFAGGKDPESIVTENPPPEAKSDISTRFIAHMPREKKDRNIENWYDRVLGSVQKTAYITNAYFIPTSEFRKALVGAARRGVDVRILTNSAETNDFALMSQAGRMSYKELLQAGVRIYEFQKGNQGGFDLLHTKGGVFDGEVATIGSHNLDPRSFNTNSECTLVVHDKEFGHEMHQMFKEDLALAKEYTLRDLKKETPADKLEQWFGGLVVKELL